MARAFKTALAASAMAILAGPVWAQGRLDLQLPCVPAPVMEQDLANQGFRPAAAKEDGDGDPWITFEHKDGRWVLVLYLVDQKAQCFVARGGKWPQEKGV